MPDGIDFAYGYQGAYQPNMKRWFVEDTVTSAIMRVQQLVMGGAERSTKEIMEQVEKQRQKWQTQIRPIIGRQSLATCQVTKPQLKPNNLAFRH
jgi:hypothetical protein